MVESTLLAISIVTGLLVLVFVIGTGRLPSWRRDASVQREPDSRFQQMIRQPSMWMIGALALCVVAVSVLIVGIGVQQTLGDSGPLGSALGAAMVVFLLALPGGYLLWGIYDLARKRGLGNAKAVGVSVWIAGMLLVGMVALTLVIG